MTSILSTADVKQILSPNSTAPRHIRIAVIIINFMMAVGIFSFYLTETILFYEDVKPSFPRNVSRTTQFFLDSTSATAVCGTITWGLVTISSLTNRIHFVGNNALFTLEYLGFIAMFILWFINIVVTGLWDYGHMGEVSQYAPSYFFTLYVFNIIFGLIGTITICEA
jgi:hypothetical protein